MSTRSTAEPPSRRSGGVVTPQEQEAGVVWPEASSLALAGEAAQAVREHELDRCAQLWRRSRADALVREM
jgi:hypothetical protein